MKHHNTVALTRRSFLATTATGLATIATRTHAAPTPKIGLVGYGAVGRSLLARTAHGEIVAVADVDRNALEQLPRDVARHSRWESLVADASVDTLVVAAPDFLQAPITEAALAAGKRVYGVPALAPSPEHTRIFARCAAAYPEHLHLLADHVMDHHWAMGAHMLREAQAGTPRWIQADVPVTIARPQGHWSLQHPWSRGDAANALFAALHPLVHHFQIDQLTAATLLGGVFASETRETPDALSFSAVHPNGLKITLTTRMPGQTRRPTVIRGAKGHVELPAPVGTPDFHFDGNPDCRVRLQSAVISMDALSDGWMKFAHSDT